MNNHTNGDDICPECERAWGSEYHMSDACVNIDEDGGKE